MEWRQGLEEVPLGLLVSEDQEQPGGGVGRVICMSRGAGAPLTSAGDTPPIWDELLPDAHRRDVPTAGTAGMNCSHCSQERCDPFSPPW